MRIAIIVFTILTTGLSVAAQPLSTVEELERWAQLQFGIGAELLRGRQLDSAVALFTTLYHTPRMDQTGMLWAGILYNLACGHALLQHPDEALAFLTEAVETGWLSSDQVERDTDLESLRSTAAFAALIGELKSQHRIWDTPAIGLRYQNQLPEEVRVAGLSKLWMEVKLNFVYFDRVPELDWDSLYLAFLPKVREARSTLQYYRTLAMLCAMLQDGHTSVTPPQELWPHLWSNPKITTQLVDGHVVITRVRSDSLKRAGVRVGMEVMTVDGVPVTKYTEELVAPYLSISGPQSRKAQVYTYNLLSGDSGRPVTLGLSDGSGKVRGVPLPRRYEWPNDPSFEWRKLKSGIIYVNIRSFGSDSVATAFDNIIDTIRASQGLIIDVRDNGGGNSDIGYHILGYLVDSTYTTLQARTRSYSSQDRVWGRAIEWETQDFRLEPVGTVPYRGSVAVLAGERTGSAAETFLVAFDVIKRGKIIGEPSTGSDGQPLLFDLPGGITARVCCKACSYPDGKQYVGVGVQPHQLVYPTVDDFRKGNDPVLEAAVRYIQTAAGR